MPKSFKWISPNRLIALVVLGLLLVAVPVYASSGGPYDLSWWTADSGGGTSSGDNYALSGTLGQADAGASLSNGTFTHLGGFWAGVGVGDWIIYLPLIIR